MDPGKIFSYQTTESAKANVFSLNSISPLTLSEAGYWARWTTTRIQKAAMISWFLKTSLFNSVYQKLCGFSIFHLLSEDWIIHVFIQVKSNQIFLIKYRLRSEGKVHFWEKMATCAEGKGCIDFELHSLKNTKYCDVLQ